MKGQKSDALIRNRKRETFHFNSFVNKQNLKKSSSDLLSHLLTKLGLLCCWRVWLKIISCFSFFPFVFLMTVSAASPFTVTVKLQSNSDAILWSSICHRAKICEAWIANTKPFSSLKQRGVVTKHVINQWGKKKKNCFKSTWTEHSKLTHYVLAHLCQ